MSPSIPETRWTHAHVDSNHEQTYFGQTFVLTRKGLRGTWGGGVGKTESADNPECGMKPKTPHISSTSRRRLQCRTANRRRGHRPRHSASPRCPGPRWAPRLRRRATARPHPCQRHHSCSHPPPLSLCGEDRTQLLRTGEGMIPGRYLQGPIRACQSRMYNSPSLGLHLAPRWQRARNVHVITKTRLESRAGSSLVAVLVLKQHLHVQVWGAAVEGLTAGCGWATADGGVTGNVVAESPAGDVE